MRADHYVDLTAFDAFDYFLLFFRRTKARQQFYLHRKGREALAKSIEVLIGEHRRRRQDGGLLAVHHGLERGTHRDFRLAVTDVAAQQAIHRRRGFHIVLHIFDRSFLIGR